MFKTSAKWALLLFCFSGIGISNSWSETADDIAKLAKNGIGEDVLMALVEKADESFDLTTEKIIELKKAGVPQKVIAAMLRKKNAEPPAPPEAYIKPTPVNQETEQEVPEQNEPVQAPPQTFEAPKVEKQQPIQIRAVEAPVVLLENRTDNAMGYLVDVSSNTVWMLPEKDGAKEIKSGEKIDLELPIDHWKIRYKGRSARQSFHTKNNMVTRLLLATKTGSYKDELWVTVYEDNKRRGREKLASFYTVTEVKTVEVVKEVPNTRVIEKEVVVYKTRPAVYVYSTPSYTYSSSSCYPYYRSTYSCYPTRSYSRNHHHHGYSSSRYYCKPKSRYSVGFRIGF